MDRPAAEALAALHAARRAEKEQTLFYRALAARAEDAADVVTAERLNGLLADEQHHFSRLSARLLELGEALAEFSGQVGPFSLAEWEEAARASERAEVVRYEQLLAQPLDPRTREMIGEFLDAERQHEKVLGGKWMGA
jgi:rubrerythrin